MKATFSKNGVLFSLDAEEKAEIADIEGMPWGDLYEAFEELSCNGWDFVDPEDIGALTDAPILSNCMGRDDDGTMTAHSECGMECGIFWFPNYMVEDPLETLRDKGEVFFTRAS